MSHDKPWYETDKWQAWWHRGLGFWYEMTFRPGASIKRERKQWPMENDRYPASWFYRNRLDGPLVYSGEDTLAESARIEYWAVARIEDSFNDMRQVAQGALVTGYVKFGLAVWLGTWIAKWIAN